MNAIYCMETYRKKQTQKNVFTKGQLILKANFEFFRKTSEWICFYYYATCFYSFFGRNWRLRKGIWKLSDLKSHCQHGEYWCDTHYRDIGYIWHPNKSLEVAKVFFPRKAKKQITKARSEKKATKVFSLKKALNFHQMRINGETTNSDKKLWY